MKNIVFDVGGVILQKGTKQYLQENLTHKEDWEIINNEIFCSVERVQLDRGSIDKETAFARMLSRIPERSQIQARELYEGYIGNRKTVDGMVELIESLKEKGYRLYVLSNFSTDFQAVIDRNKFDFFKLFDGVFVSCNYGVVKPEREIYQTFLKTYGLEAKDCLFIDDKEENVEGAICAGMDGFVFRGDAKALERYIQAKGDSEK